MVVRGYGNRRQADRKLEAMRALCAVTLTSAVSKSYLRREGYRNGRIFKSDG